MSIKHNLISYLAIIIISVSLVLPITTNTIVITNNGVEDKTIIGLASWYDYRIIGRYGYVCKREVEDCYTEYSAVGASRDFPRYSLVKVCSLDSPLNCTIVKITDWIEHPNRVLDLSSYAFSQLSPLSIGLIEVSITEIE